MLYVYWFCMESMVGYCDDHDYLGLVYELKVLLI